ncbi:MAG: hypothetical protein H7Y42_17890 [Chitinophagaceae bacterium]|nr:hypothetical protein [Chitinophagaceae bacterium]
MKKIQFVLAGSSRGMLLLLSLAIVIVSCSVIGGVNKKQFTFYRNEKLVKLVILLPKGRVEERFRVGSDDGKEQFYDFNDGAVFYIARNTTWPTVNQHRMVQPDMKRSSSSGLTSGTDNNGLYWKEIRLEEFQIGYAYVPATHVNRFDDALNSIRIKQ